MIQNRLTKLFKKFSSDKSGETAIQTTLIFSFAVVIGVMFGIPLLNDAAKEYAYNKNYGVDTVVTSSIGDVNKPVKRYTIRKTIFDTEEQ